MNKIVKTVALILIVALITVGIVYAFTYLTLNGSVTVQTPTAITISDSTLPFGTLAPDGTSIISRTLTNSGGTPSNALSITTTLPSSVGTLTWDADGKTVPAHGNLIVQFTLTVNSTATDGSTNFNVNING